MNPDPNLGMVERIATALGQLRDRVVFVGGSATGLLITDPLAAAIRVTKDVDVIVAVASHGAYYQIEEALRAHGIRNDTREGAPLCRWLWEELILDPAELPQGKSWGSCSMTRSSAPQLKDTSLEILEARPAFRTFYSG